MQKAFVRAFKIPVRKVKAELQESVRKINLMSYDADKKKSTTSQLTPEAIKERDEDLEKKRKQPKDKFCERD